MGDVTRLVRSLRECGQRGSLGITAGAAAGSRGPRPLVAWAGLVNADALIHSRPGRKRIRKQFLGAPGCWAVDGSLCRRERPVSACRSYTAGFVRVRHCEKREKAPITTSPLTGRFPFLCSYGVNLVRRLKNGRFTSRCPRYASVRPSLRETRKIRSARFFCCTVVTARRLRTRCWRARSGPHRASWSLGSPALARRSTVGT